MLANPIQGILQLLHDYRIHMKLPANNVPPAPPGKQVNNPLHGLTLEAIITTLEAHYGWEELAARIPVRCFSHDPSIASSLKFLRKTPWARDKVEKLYILMLRVHSRAG